MAQILLMDDEIDYQESYYTFSSDFKFGDLLKRLHIGSTKYVNTLCGHPTSV